MKIVPPAISDIEAFVTIAKEGGLTAAGKRLQQNPSTLRMAMQRIGSVIGGEPFVRVKGGLELSRLGKDFVGDANAMLHQWYMIRDRLDGRKHEMVGSFRLCCIPEAGVIVLPSVFKYLETKYPQIVLAVVGPELRTIAETVNGGAADFGLTVEKNTGSNLVRKVVFNTTISVWSNKQFKDIPRRLFVDPAFNDFEEIHRKLKQKFSGEIVRIDSLNLVAELAEQGCGYGLLPDVVAKRSSKLTSSTQHKHIGEVAKISLIYRTDLEKLVAAGAVVEAFAKATK